GGGGALDLLSLAALAAVAASRRALRHHRRGSCYVGRTFRPRVSLNKPRNSRPHASAVAAMPACSIVGVCTRIFRPLLRVLGDPAWPLPAGIPAALSATFLVRGDARTGLLSNCRPVVPSSQGDFGSLTITLENRQLNQHRRAPDSRHRPLDS